MLTHKGQHCSGTKCKWEGKNTNAYGDGYLTYPARTHQLGQRPDRHAAPQDYRAKTTVEVKDSSDALIPGAALTLTRVSPKGTTTAKMDAQGVNCFSFSSQTHIHCLSRRPA
jgi:hypothetical protein